MVGTQTPSTLHRAPCLASAHSLAVLLPHPTHPSCRWAIPPLLRRRGPNTQGTIPTAVHNVKVRPTTTPIGVQDHSSTPGHSSPRTHTRTRPVPQLRSIRVLPNPVVNGNARIATKARALAAVALLPLRYTHILNRSAPGPTRPDPPHHPPTAP